MSTSYSATLAQVLHNVTLYMDIITYVFGPIGCIGNIITLTSRQMRRSSAVFYLLCAAASQLVTILVCVGFRLFHDRLGSDLQNRSTAFCKFRYYLAVTLPAIASYYMALASFDRFLCTSGKARIRAWSQIKVAKRLSAVMLLVNVTMSVHILILFNIHTNVCQIRPGSAYTFVYAGYLIIVVIFLPHILMLVFSVLTVISFLRSHLRVAPSMTGNRIPIRRGTFELKIIRIILVQVFLSILLSMLRFGSASYRSIVFVIVPPTVDQRAAEAFAETVGSSLYFFNYAISFYATILSSRFFRTAFYARVLLFHRHCLRQLRQIHLCR